MGNEEKTIWDWLAARIPELKDSKNKLWISQANDLLREIHNTPQSTNSKEQEQGEQLECAYEGCSNFCCNVDKHGLCCDCQEDMKHTSK